MSQYQDPNNKALAKIEQSILFEIVELDDIALDAVSGGLKEPVEANGSCTSNGSSCNVATR